MMNENWKSRIMIAVVVVAALLAGWLMANAIRATSRAEAPETLACEFHRSTLDFLNLFINQVLLAKGEIDFEARLKLENAVRALNEPKIMEAWRQFVESSSEGGAQVEVKNLLAVIAGQICPTGQGR